MITKTKMTVEQATKEAQAADLMGEPPSREAIEVLKAHAEQRGQPPPASVADYSSDDVPGTTKTMMVEKETAPPTVEKKKPRQIVQVTERTKQILARQEKVQRTKELPAGATARITAPSPDMPEYRRQLDKANRDMKSFGKSFVPGWQLKEDWKNLNTAEKAAGIAGAIGQTILYVVPIAYGSKALYVSRPTPKMKGTIKNIPGVRIYTRKDLNQAVKDMVAAEKVQKKGVKSKEWVPLDYPVKQKTGITTIVEETLAKGGNVLKSPKLRIIPTKPTKGAGGGRTLTQPKAPPRGTAGGRAIDTSTMTRAQVLRLLGVQAVTTVKLTPVSAPSPKPGPKPQPAPTKTPITEPEPFAEPVRTTRTTTRPRTVPTSQPSPEPSPTGTGESELAPSPKPTPTPKPKPEPTPTPEPATEPAVGKAPAPVSTTTKTQTKTPKRAIVTWNIRTKGATDRETRRMILKARGAIAWRMGELKGRDVWDVVTAPYTYEENYVRVVGRKPTGAVIIKGPGSARKTARVLYGHRIKNPTVVNTPGLFAVRLIPISNRKGISISFIKDVELTKKIGSIGGRGNVFPLEKKNV